MLSAVETPRDLTPNALEFVICLDKGGHKVLSCRRVAGLVLRQDSLDQENRTLDHFVAFADVGGHTLFQRWIGKIDSYEFPIGPDGKLVRMVLNVWPRVVVVMTPLFESLKAVAIFNSLSRQEIDVSDMWRVANE